MDTKDRIRLLYRHILGREADEGGLTHWTAYADRQGLGGVAEALAGSAEYEARVLAAAPQPFPPALRDACLKALGRDLLIVDVGAQKLGYEDHIYQALLSTGAYKIIGFEPLEEARKARMSQEGDLRLVLLPDFVGDGSEQTFYINNYDATSSLYPLDQSITKLFVDLSPIETERSERVKTEPLDKLIGDVARVDFLKLDIQGYELHALRGAAQVLGRTNVVHCEVEFCPFYAGQPLFSEVEMFLRGHGFILGDLVREARGTYHLPSGNLAKDRLLYAEAVFFKEAAPVDYLAQAIVAWLVYDKRGLSEYLLGLHDKAHGTSFGAALQSL